MTPGLPPPAIVQPAPYEVSYGLVTGTVAPGHAAHRRAGRKGAFSPIAGCVARHFTVRVDCRLERRPWRSPRSTRTGRRSTATVSHVLGLPRRRHRSCDRRAGRAGSRRRFAASSTAFRARRASTLPVSRPAPAPPGTRERQFPAASTLKLAIAVAALARVAGVPARGSYLDDVLRRMLVVSDNEAANELEVWLGGSTSAGGHIVTDLMARSGSTTPRCTAGTSGSSHPGAFRFVSTTNLAGVLASARRLAISPGSCARSGSRAAGGPAAHAAPGFTPGDARYLLYLLAHVEDTGKLDRELGELPGLRVLHKAGWIKAARHDNGLVFWHGGVFVVTVMTYRQGGAGKSSDVLAGRVARVRACAFCRQTLREYRYTFRS